MTSLFQDPQLLEQLLELTKEAQAVIPPPPAVDVHALAQKLVRNLKRTMGGGLSEISGGGAANISTLGNLSSLLKTLADNKIRIDGDRAAFTKAEYDSLSPDEKEGLSFFTAETLREADNRLTGVDYYVNVPALSNYLRHLHSVGKDQEGKGQIHSGKLLQVMTTNLLKKVDPEADIAPPAPPKPEVAPLDDATIVDSFGSKVFDEKAPLEGVEMPLGRAPFTLRLGDLKSRTTLDAWLHEGTSYVVIYDAQGRKQALQYDGTTPVDSCSIIHVLYRRAQDKKNAAAGDPGKTRIADAYLQAVQNVSAQFTGLDGKPCSVILPDAGKPEAAKPGIAPPGTMTPAQEATIISNTLENLPFEEGRINLRRFESFFSIIGPLAFDPSLQSYLQQARTSIGEIRRVSSQEIFDLDEPLTQMAHLIKEPSGYWAGPMATLLQSLMRLLVFTRQALELFWFRLPMEQRTATPGKLIVAQIGRTSSDYSLYQRNYLAIQRKAVELGHMTARR
jgi:hypothetical protein